MEIRAATRADLEQVLTIRSTSFNIAREDWPQPDEIADSDLPYLRVVDVDGLVVSCLTVYPSWIFVGSSQVPMGGIGNVATLPSVRNRGYATALMRDTIRSLREWGLSTSVLFPYSFNFYRKFGYELGGNHCQFWSRPGHIPAFRERGHCRPAQPEDADPVQELYENYCSIRSCALVRPPERWSHFLSNNGTRAVVFDRDAVSGYLLFKEEIDSHGLRVFRVHEIVSSSPDSSRGLIGYLSQFDGDTVEWSTTVTDLAGMGLLCSVAPLREGHKPRGIATVRPMFQFRVIDILEAMKARIPDLKWLEGELSLVIRDEICPDNAEPIAIGCKDGTVQLFQGHRTDYCLEGDIRVFSQLYCGYLSPTEAYSQQLIRFSDPEGLPIADQMFPKFEPFIPDVDRF
jgi:predicted acetyltransferase